MGEQWYVSPGFIIKNSVAFLTSQSWQLTMKRLNDMTREKLRDYLSNLTIDKIPLGNSRFKCEKHDRVLPYTDIVSGCWFCIEDEARKDEYDYESGIGEYLQYVF